MYFILLYFVSDRGNQYYICISLGKVICILVMTVKEAGVSGSYDIDAIAKQLLKFDINIDIIKEKRT